ncbi:MAG: dihydropteroate synthase [Solitalea-like symbiont of Acarus siro]
MLINVGGKLIDLSIPRVMGIINVTPDSFYAESRRDLLGSLKTAEQFLKEGCDILDIGAYSSWIHSKEISSEQEWARLEEPLNAIRKEFHGAVISIDTFRADVEKKAINCGANIINDISGGSLDSKMVDVISSCQVPYILMHMRGTPNNMQDFTQYEDLIVDLTNYFVNKITVLRERKVKDIIIDPGFGFSKSLEQNYILLNHLDKFKIFDLPILVGLSRKSMIYKLFDISAKDALNGTSVLNFVALNNGANILRVHDVKEAKQVVKLYDMLNDN